MNSEKKRIRNKTIIIGVICFVIAVVALFGLTFSRFRAKDINGRTEFDPALFNTALLGKLVDDDISKLVVDKTSLDYYKLKIYTCSNEDCKAEITCTGDNVCTICPYCQTHNSGDSAFSVKTYQQSLHGAKIAASLDLSKATEFAAEGIVPVEPGTEKTFLFTVTNGTNIEDDEDNPKRIKNVAETDIKYTLHIKTDNNLRLEYTLKDLDTGITYNLKDKLEKEETKTEGEYQITKKVKGATSDYVVDTDSYGIADFVNGSRILKNQSDGSITVHRYQLTIKWPSNIIETSSKKKIDEEETEIVTEVIKNNDSSYMKELENIEVLLEIESYVNSVKKTGDSDMVSDGVAVLSATPVSDGLYSLKAPVTVNGVVTSYTPVTVYVATEARTNAFKAADPIDVSDLYDYNYAYNLHIYNGDYVEATWVADDPTKTEYEDRKTGTSDIRGINGQTDSTGTSLKDGHYEYISGNLVAGTGYHVILAVPSGDNRMNDSDTDWARSRDHKYYLIYNGEIYTGVLSGEVVQSDAVTYDETRVGHEYQSETVTQYVAYRFYDSDNNELALNFTDTTLQEEVVTLYRSSDYEYVSCKDDYRVYIDN